MRRRMIGLESYQAIKTPPEWDEPSTEDYFEKFFSEWSGKEKVSDDDYEIVHRWWYEFKAYTGCDWDDGVDTELEEMKESLEAIDQRRKNQTCETCRKFGRCPDAWKHFCRTGNNDDYTMYDYYRKRMTIEDWKKEAEEQKKKVEYWISRSCDYGNELFYIKNNLLDDNQKEKLAEWKKEQKND